MTKWLIDPESERVLGCGIVGSGAGDLIERGGPGDRDGRGRSAISPTTIHPHPTLSETLGAAAEVHYGTATDLYRPKRNR